MPLLDLQLTPDQHAELVAHIDRWRAEVEARGDRYLKLKKATKSALSLLDAGQGYLEGLQALADLGATPKPQDQKEDVPLWNGMTVPPIDDSDDSS